MAPLPRAHQWVSSPAYASHVERLGKVPGSAMPPSLYAEPLLRQGGSDCFIGPCDDVVLASEAFGIDFEAQLAVITGDVPMGASPERALDSIRLLMLASDVCLRSLGAVQGRPMTAFAPVAVTLDEAGDAWRQGRLSLNLQTTWNGRKVGLCEAGAGMTFHFGQLMSHLCRTRPVSAGSIVGAGPVSHPDWDQGYSCIAEKRAVETADTGKPKTRFMKFGDTVRIEVKEKNGQSLFGAIAQEVTPLA
jgi:fumarylacetoacetate (FAA) hydrolase